MVFPRRFPSAVLWLVVVVYCCFVNIHSASAITASNVVVLYNTGNPISIAVASYYAAQHTGVRMVGLSGVPDSEQISESDYRTIIRPQVQAALDPSVDVIVTTKGLPLRIYNDKRPPKFPFTYTDPQGVSRTIYNTSYRQYSSLESELTRIDTISTWVQMGDQTWWSPNAATSNLSLNPYYGRDARFSNQDPANGKLRLSTRLDGYSVADIQGSIDRAKNVQIVPTGHQIVIDDSPAAVAAGVTSMPALANNVLKPRGQSYIYDQQVAPVLTAPKPVIGYVSHGVNDGSGQLPPNYMLSKLDFNLAKGAIAETWESFNGYSFNPGGRHGQGSLADWIASGGTAGVAQVEEPGASLSNMTNESRMFELMLKGYTWAEAAWNATPQVSYVNTVIGDPLMVWHQWIPGDANLDGKVNVSDYTIMRANWLKPGTYATGDFNGDGIVNSADLSVLRAQWMGSNTGIITSTMFTNGSGKVPEPSALFGVLLASFAGLLRRR